VGLAWAGPVSAFRVLF
jgi:hypothetical protein